MDEHPASEVAAQVHFYGHGTGGEAHDSQGLYENGGQVNACKGPQPGERPCFNKIGDGIALEKRQRGVNKRGEQVHADKQQEFTAPGTQIGAETFPGL